MNQVTLVSSPDDVLHDGVRILLVDLNNEQTQALSEVLLTIEKLPPMVLYVWHSGNPIEWLLDKKHKADAIIFNADSQNNDLVTGYVAAQPNSFYFGTLKDLDKVNNRAIYITDDLKRVINNLVEHYGL